jgi:hypothetical protein
MSRQQKESCGCVSKVGQVMQMCETHKAQHAEIHERWAADLKRGWFREEREAHAVDDGSDLI